MTEIATGSMSLEAKAEIVNRVIASAIDFSDDGLKSRMRILRSFTGAVTQAQLLALESETLGRELWLDWEPRVVDGYQLIHKDKVEANLDDGWEPEFDLYPEDDARNPNHPDYGKTRDVSGFNETRERDWVNLAG